MSSPILNNRKILITGATGFIGANLVRYCLALGAKVFIFTRRSSNRWRISDCLDKVSEYYVDLADFKKLNDVIHRIRPEFILHTAAYGGYPEEHDAKKIFEVNSAGTVNLVLACAKTSFKLFINTGSSSEYGINNRPMKEEDILEPLTDYGAAKASATLFCQARAKREGLPIITLRLFSPYGYYEDQSRLVPYTITSCLKKQNPRFSAPNNVRDFVFIEDMLEAYLKAIMKADKFEAGSIINIGSGRQHTISEVVGTIINLTGYNIKPIWKRIANPRVEPRMWKADISRARSILGWQPHHNFRQGLTKTIEWFRDNLKLYR